MDGWMEDETRADDAFSLNHSSSLHELFYGTQLSLVRHSHTQSKLLLVSFSIIPGSNVILALE